MRITVVTRHGHCILKKMLMWALTAQILSSGLAPAGERPLKVTDIVEMTELADPDIKMLSYLGRAQFSVSADGHWFAFVTRKGNLSSGKNDYELKVVEREAISHYLRRQKGPLPQTRVLLRVSSSERSQWEWAIRSLKWQPDNHTLAFIAEENDEPSQAYAVDAATGAVDKLTAAPQPVLSFDYDLRTKRVVFLSRPEEPNPADGVSSYAVGTRSLSQVLFPWEPGYAARHHQFYVSTAGGDPIPVGSPFKAVSPSPLWISPDGHWAIALQPVADDAVVANWASSYQALQSVYLEYMVGASAKRFDAAYMSRDPPGVNQFVLLNIDAHSSRPLFAAPTGSGPGGVFVDVHWRSDSANVILANTLLPLDVPDGTERERRSRYAAVAEYNIHNGHLAWIAPIKPKLTDAEPDESFVQMDVVSDDLLRITDASSRKTCLYDQSGQWKVSRECDAYEAKSHRVTLDVQQDMNTPPNIVAHDPYSGRRGLITDLNPQFRELTFGTVKLFDWKDRAGVQWKGGLLYPPHFDATRRYPLVIQTYGFKPGVFIIDHQMRGSSAFAAQAFANQGMLVLLLPEPAVDSQSREWLTAHQQGIEAAIDRLDALTLIDRTKVGIIGFSATGLPVQHMLTFSDYDIAAATIADSWGITLSAYAGLFGHPAPAMLSVEDMMQAHPWGDSLPLWTQRDPSLHVDRVRAALRIETYGPVSNYWDMYALMRRQHKPADLIVFPNGWHQLRNPRQRLDSLQGNVDWFSFWLQGREDPDPAKEDQYRRWRGLRSERNAPINSPAAD